MLFGLFGLGPTEVAIVLGLVVLIGFAVLRSSSSIKPQMISCVRCGELTTRAGFSVWQILCGVFLFPLGLLAFLAGRKPTECHKCGNTWVA